jgi:hypothetical protein
MLFDRRVQSPSGGSRQTFSQGLRVSIAVAVLVLLAMHADFPVHAQNVFQVVLHAVDANNLPLQYPVLFSISGFGNVTSYHDGSLTLSIPYGQRHISAWVFRMLVGEVDIMVDRALDLIVPTRVYELKVTVSGVSGNDSRIDGFAYAFFGVNGFVNISFSRAVADFKQLPAGGVSLLITRHDGTPIATGQLTLGQNDEITVYYTRFFHVFVQVFDADKVPVVGASISLGLLSNTTDLNGTASLFAPAGNIAVQVTFRGVLVYVGSVSVINATTMSLKVAVGRFQALLINELGQPLANRDIAVKTAGWRSSIKTDAQGYLTIDQLPYGTVALQILPGGVEKSVDFPLPQNIRSIQLFTGPLVVQAEVLSAVMFGSLKVKVTVKMGALPITNATVLVNGRVVSLGADGTLTIPVGLEWEPKANVTVKAYGVTKSLIVSSPASPVALATFPLAFLPVIVWRIMLVRYKRRRPPLYRT